MDISFLSFSPLLIPSLISIINEEYDPYDYTVEVGNRFKGPNLIDQVPDELRTEAHDIVQETGIKTIPMEKKCKKANGCLTGPYK